jgi:hypothetical protein
VCALLKVPCILPMMKVENEHYENGWKHLKTYLNTLTDQRSSNVALLT